MTLVTASSLATAVNAAWNTETHAKPVTPAGSGFVTDWRTCRHNLIEEVGPGGRPHSYASKRGVFTILMRHPTEAAIDYLNTIVNALTIASTIHCSILSRQRLASGEFESVFKVVIKQFS